MMVMAEHPSLEVSAQPVHILSTLFAQWVAPVREALLTIMGQCMKLCTERLVRYDHFPEDSIEPSVAYAIYDCEDYPERHAMIGNYRKSCRSAIESITQRKPHEATSYVIELCDVFLKTHDLTHTSPEGGSIATIWRSEVERD